MGLGIVRGFSTNPDYRPTITKYTSEMMPLKTRVFGDGNYHNMVLGKLHDGTYVLVVSMRIQEKSEQLIFYRLDKDLEDYFN
jgi:hypothetical protein